MVEWGATPREQVTVMPAGQAKSDTPEIFLASCLNRVAYFDFSSAGYACGLFCLPEIDPSSIKAFLADETAQTG